MATSKVYYCSVCEDEIAYNRKEYFKHIKTEQHKYCLNYSKNIDTIRSFVCADEKNQGKNRTRRNILNRTLTNLSFIDELDALENQQ